MTCLTIAKADLPPATCNLSQAMALPTPLNTPFPPSPQLFLPPLGPPSRTLSPRIKAQRLCIVSW